MEDGKGWSVNMMGGGVLVLTIYDLRVSLEFGYVDLACDRFSNVRYILNLSFLVI